MEAEIRNIAENQETQSPIRLDKFIFLICMLTNCAFGFIFTKYCNIHKCSPFARYAISFCFGISVVFLCYGIRSGHLLFMSLIVYLILHMFPPQWAFWISFLFCIAYSSWAHIKRMIFDYGGYSADVSLPLMVHVQRLTLLSANLLDGHLMTTAMSKKNKMTNSENNSNRHTSYVDGTTELTPIQKQYAVSQLPSLMQFLSYSINFQTILTGPPLNFRDYQVYIEGSEVDEKRLNAEQRAIFLKNRESFLQPAWEIKNYAIQGGIFLLLYLTVCQYFKPSFFLSETFANFTFWHKCAYLLLTNFTLRQHYYFAWSLCSLTCLVSGLGFNGFDKNGKADYSLVKSYNFCKSEFPGSVKCLMDNWNLQTLKWLRITVFVRAPKRIAVLAVFVVSVFWHGFYPGYYLFFFSVGWYSVVGRLIRHRLRPRILGFLPDTKWVWTSKGRLEGTSWTYEIITFVMTYSLINYTALAFVLLSFRNSIIVWSRFYFAGHLLCLVVHLLLLAIPSTVSNSKKTS